MADILACLFGALLLVAAVVLVAVLPDKEYASPQFRLTFPDTVDDFTYATQRFNFSETDEASKRHDFAYVLPDNVASLNLRAEFKDDIAHSDPDQFRLEVFDPAGNPVGTRYDAINKPPTPDTANQTQFVISSYSNTFNVPIGEHPTEQIVTGLTHQETAEQALARLEPQYRSATAGTWTVRVTLIQANDCATPPNADVFQFTRCRSEAGQDGEDPGNDFALAGFIYTFYTPTIEALGK
jgi:hypothetical protein